MVHSATHMTPHDAKLKANALNVNMNSEMKRRRARVFPAVEVGDSVKTYKKKTVVTKDRYSRWSGEVHIVEYITESHCQKLFKQFSDRERPCLRNVILLLG